MKDNPLLIVFFFCSLAFYGQTKMGGYVIDTNNNPVAFANVIFKGTTTGTITNENGKFYLETDQNIDTLVVSFIGYATKEVNLNSHTNFNLKITLEEELAELGQVVIVSGKQPKKNNPAIDILRKIWANKRRNGVKIYKQYQYDKYEKIEFDINTIDSALMKSRMFKGIEFVFEQVDTSSVTGKTYLPIFINEAASTIYGDNLINKEREELKGNKNSGFSNNQIIIDFVGDLYSDYNVYDNYIKIFDKSFVSPLSTTGIDNYNYVLADSAFIDNKWCYNILYYPRRKNELTFKGDFWVNDTTYAIKRIELQVNKSANINWIKDIYIEQEFDVLNDSVFLIKRDYFLSDFAFRKKEEARGVYGKRTTIYDNYKFDIPKESAFYNQKVFDFNEELYNRDDEFWAANRLEKLNNEEKGIYTMLDTLRNTRKFKQLYTIGSILTSGYIEFSDLNMDYGPIFSMIGYNDVEGLRIRTGGRTYFGRNDPWRIEGFLAYGFKDDKFKYGISGKWLIDKKSRLIISGGNRRDIEQIGASLTNSTDVLGRDLASSALFTVGSNDKLTNINLSTLALEIEPLNNLSFRLGGSYRTLESASSTFSLNYYDDDSPTGISSEIKQFESTYSVFYFPGRKTTGYGVERIDLNDDYGRIFAQLSVGDNSLFNSGFNYTKLQLLLENPFFIGGFGVLRASLEAGKTFGEVPLGLLSVVPGNQTYFSISNSFSQLDYYEFVTDTYASLHLKHNFNGRLFARVPLLRDLNLREIVGFRAVWGEISDQNKALNASGLIYNSPDDKIYWEYSFGVGNIFKVLQLDLNFRGNYKTINSRNFGLTFSFGFHF